MFDTNRGLPFYDLTPAAVQALEISSQLVTPAVVTRSKEVIAAGFNSFYNPTEEIKPDNIFITKRTSDGVIVALWYMVKEIRDSGKTPKALLIAPAYGLFQKVLQQLDVEVVETESFTGKIKNCERVRVLQDAFSKHPDVNLFVVNSPSNPLGQLYSQDVFSEILRQMEHHPDLRVLSDTVYDRLSNPSHSGFNLFQLADSELREKIIEVSGNSKTFATGDRKAIGWMISSPSTISTLMSTEELKKIDPKVTTRHEALQATAEVMQDSAYWQHAWDSYRSRMRSITNIVRPATAAFADISFGESGYYLTVDFTKSGIDVDVLCARLATKGISLPHGDGYGGRNVLRLCAGSTLTSRAYALEHGLDFTERKSGEFYFPDDFVASPDLGLFRILANEMKQAIGEMRADSRNGGAAHGALLR